jgi:hypothetical protein
LLKPEKKKMTASFTVFKSKNYFAGTYLRMRTTISDTEILKVYLVFTVILSGYSQG